MTNPLTNNKPEEVIAELPAEKKEFSIGSSKFTLTELTKELKLEGLEDQEKYQVIAMHIRKGSVQPLNKQTKTDKVLMNVTKGLAQIAQIRQLAEEQQQSVVAKRTKTNEDRLTYPDIKFSVANRVVMEDVRAYLQNKGIAASVIQDVDSYEFIFTVAEATDAELNSLDRYLRAKEFVVKAKSVSAQSMSVTSTVIKGALATTAGVVSGATKVTVDVVGKTAEAVTEIGASAVVRTRSIYNEAARNLSNNKEAMEAKEMLSSGWDMLKTKFGGKKSNRFF